MDLSVNKDALSRLARVPYSKHQLTDLSVVPFLCSDDYENIMAKSLDPNVEKFEIERYYTDFSKHLQKIDEIEYYNSKLKTMENQVGSQPTVPSGATTRWPMYRTVAAAVYAAIACG